MLQFPFYVSPVSDLGTLDLNFRFKGLVDSNYFKLKKSERKTTMPLGTKKASNPRKRILCCND